MSTQSFWNVIGNYNQHTWILQVIVLIFVAVSIVLSYSSIKMKWLAKFALGIANLYIGIVFFAIYGTEPIQHFFALPLYSTIGTLMIYESISNKDDTLNKPNRWQCLLLLLYLLYPAISMGLGNPFPQMTTYVMPCPIISLSIAVYTSYKQKNKLILVLLTIWGLTGIKSLFFSAYEDIILLICGIYGVYLLIQEFKKQSAKSEIERK